MNTLHQYVIGIDKMMSNALVQVKIQITFSSSMFQLQFYNINGQVFKRHRNTRVLPPVVDNIDIVSRKPID